MADSTNSTLYPKITNHVDEVTKTLMKLNSDPVKPEKEVVLDPIPIVGTVKLHGTHADILIHSDDSVVFQLRNIVGLVTSKDNAGFATAMSQKTKALFHLRELYITHYRKLNPFTSIDPTLPVLIAGEWIGSGIQKGLAVAELTKRFVIVSAHINGRWQKTVTMAVSHCLTTTFTTSRARGITMHIIP
jgi:hypothetical protein